VCVCARARARNLVNSHTFALSFAQATTSDNAAQAQRKRLVVVDADRAPHPLKNEVMAMLLTMDTLDVVRVRESDVSKMSKVGHDHSVFMLDSFQGPAFDTLISSKCDVIGTPIVAANTITDADPFRKSRRVQFSNDLEGACRALDCVHVRWPCVCVLDVRSLSASRACARLCDCDLSMYCVGKIDDCGAVCICVLLFLF
jgi:hypothetical protein